MSEGEVSFLFQGQAEVPSATISIPATALQGPHCDTFLSSLASECWSNPTARPDSSILVTPLKSCPLTWSPALADVIAAYYCGSPIVLPPQVELEELLSVFDFFGLTIDAASVDLSAADVASRVRGRIMLQQEADLQTAIEHTTAFFEEKPQLSATFLGCESFMNISYIMKATGDRFEILGTNLARDRRKHFDWSQSEFHRKNMISALAEAGFDSTWKKGFYAVSGPEGEFDHRTEAHAFLYALTVKIPALEPLEKRRKICTEE